MFPSTGLAFYQPMMAYLVVRHQDMSVSRFPLYPDTDGWLMHCVPPQGLIILSMFFINLRLLISRIFIIDWYLIGVTNSVIYRLSRQRVVRQVFCSPAIRLFDSRVVLATTAISSSIVWYFDTKLDTIAEKFRRRAVDNEPNYLINYEQLKLKADRPCPRDCLHKHCSSTQFDVTCSMHFP